MCPYPVPHVLPLLRTDIQLLKTRRDRQAALGDHGIDSSTYWILATTEKGVGEE